MTAPYRKKRHDRILAGMAAPDEIRCDMVTGPLDHATRQMDRKWGVDRLPDLVSLETAAKWGDALAKLNVAIQSGDVETTKARTAACIRGLAVMDAEATAAGHQPANPAVWEIEHNGKRIGIFADSVEWQAAAAARPDLTLYSLAEVAVALLAYREAGPVIEAVKSSFPGAAIVSIRQPANIDLGGDYIPF